MIIVHHLENSRSQRILWLLEELALPYEVKRYERNKQTMLAPPELKAVHPLGKSPVIEDDGLVVAETGAIVEYLVEKASKLGAPADRADALRYRFWLHYAEGSLMPPLLVKLVLARVPIFGKMAMKRIQPMIDVHLDYIESELARRLLVLGRHDDRRRHHDELPVGSRARPRRSRRQPARHHRLARQSPRASRLPTRRSRRVGLMPMRDEIVVDALGLEPRTR